VVLFLAVAALVLWMEEGEPLKGGDRVAVVRLEGMVVESEPVVQALERMGKNPKVKAIVLRVDSPGGGVAPTQEIFRAVRRWNETKKVVASLGSVAASGGYYAACGAERIVANPGTITGSIGVVIHFANLEQLLGKLGIQGESIKSGSYKDMGSPFRSLSEEEKDLLQGLVRDVHEQFVEAVAEARRLPKERVSELADGRVFSGRQAKGLGLVDELGGFQEAVKTAAQLAGISGEPKLVEERKEKISLLEILLGKTMGRLIPSVDPRLPFVSYLFHP